MLLCVPGRLQVSVHGLLFRYRVVTAENPRTLGFLEISRTK
jgi:hypothetical protein